METCERKNDANVIRNQALTQTKEIQSLKKMKIVKLQKKTPGRNLRKRGKIRGNSYNGGGTISKV